MIFQDKVVAVYFFVAAQIGDIRANYAVRIGIFITVLVGRGRVIDELKFPDVPVSTIGIGRFDELILVPWREHDRTGMNGFGSDDADQIGIGAREIAGVMEHMPDDNLLLLIGGGVTRPGPVHDHTGMDAPERIVAWENHVPGGPNIAV